MAFRIKTAITITAVDSDDDCSPGDLEQVGMHEMAFISTSTDPIRVHAQAMTEARQRFGLEYPEQFRIEVAYPEGAEVIDLNQTDDPDDL